MIFSLVVFNSGMRSTIQILNATTSSWKRLSFHWASDLRRETRTWLSMKFPGFHSFYIDIFWKNGEPMCWINLYVCNPWHCSFQAAFIFMTATANYHQHLYHKRGGKSRIREPELAYILDYVFTCLMKISDHMDCICNMYISIIKISNTYIYMIINSDSILYI